MQSVKRSAEDFARVNHGANKKARFDVRNPSTLAPDALEDDATLDADVIGARGQQVKRGAVNVDGYDSDSDNENFDARAAARAKAQDEAAKQSKVEEENDMFADLDEDFKDGDDDEGDADRRGGVRKNKNVQFLDEAEIEGEVKDSKSGGHVSADFTMSSKSKGKGKDYESGSDSDSEVDDARRADVEDIDEELGAGGKKSHAPKIDAFNMREENEDGKFDEQGNYVRKAADPDAKYDVWMEGVSKKDMKKAQEAHEKREQERRQKAIEDDSKSDGQVLGDIIRMLQPSETILEALARLKPKNTKLSWHEKKRQKEQPIQENAAGQTAEAHRKQNIDAITECADLLLTRGQAEIYDTEREMLIRQYQRSTGEQWVEQEEPITADQRGADTAQWQYRWSDARDGGDVHGPFPGSHMKAWSDAGYFREGVEFQRVGDANDWIRVADFDVE